ncbi:hypothetical protein HDU67_008039 [Dinochytrium kinnereticum]|nr:hypothetical protein HDU67_008039 [Dinochytrium kinnereticum]
MISDLAIRSSAWAYVALIIITNLPRFTLFSLHPISMALLFAVLAEAGLAFLRRKAVASGHDHHHDHQHDGQGCCSHDNVSAKPIITKSEQIDTHASLAFAALAFSVLGFGVIFYVKSTNGKSHFSTWHGFLGIVIFAMGLVQGFGGMQGRKMRNYQFLRMHRSNGLGLMFLFALVSHLHLESLFSSESWMAKSQIFPLWGVICEAPLIVATVGMVARIAERL